MLQLKNELKENLIVVILCAGEGKRLKKLTKDVPKPLLKIKILNDENILHNTIYQLVNIGIEQIAIIIGHLGTTIKNYISKLIKKDPSLRNKLTIIDSKNQYKLGPLFSFLSITEKKRIYNSNMCYLLIPGDTLFDYNILKEVFFKISDNFNLIRKSPFLFYRSIGFELLKELYNRDRIISNAEVVKIDSEIILKTISQLKIREISPNQLVNQIIPLIGLSYDSINQILNLNRNYSYKTVWQALNSLILDKIKIL
ncbi:MAG: sugar phosphate nucleotidyltransferase, partial [Candidatus Odinarchaeota archaeon]